MKELETSVEHKGKTYAIHVFKDLGQIGRMTTATASIHEGGKEIHSLKAGSKNKALEAARTWVRKR